MKEFIEFILQFGNLNEQQIGLISKKSQVVELEKGDFFWEAGKSIKHVGFTIKGILKKLVDLVLQTSVITTYQ